MDESSSIRRELLDWVLGRCQGFPGLAGELIEFAWCKLNSAPTGWPRSLAVTLQGRFAEASAQLRRLGHLTTWDQFRDVQSILFRPEQQLPPLFARCQPIADPYSVLIAGQALLLLAQRRDTPAYRAALLDAAIEIGDVYGIDQERVLNSAIDRVRHVEPLEQLTERDIVVAPLYDGTRVRLLDSTRSRHALRVNRRAPLGLIYGQIDREIFVVGLD